MKKANVVALSRTLLYGGREKRGEGESGRKKTCQEAQEIPEPVSADSGWKGGRAAGRTGRAGGALRRRLVGQFGGDSNLNRSQRQTSKPPLYRVAARVL